MDRRELFQSNAVSRSGEELKSLVTLAKNGDSDAKDKLCACLAWVAFACPAATTQVYDFIASSWLDIEQVCPEVENHSASIIPDQFWTAFWSLIDDAEQGYDATSITLRAAGLGAFVDAQFGPIAESAAENHPGARGAAKKSIPDLIKVSDLRGNEQGSLANDLYRMWTDNNFDPEVLDRESIGLSRLPASLRYLNTRILQMHDVWHLVAGYETTSLHEIAISSFQLAQFGHNYSSMFLSSVLMITNVRSPEGFPLLMHVIAEAWLHGRRSPSFMDIEWENIWHQSAEDIRDQYGIKPFQSIFPPDLIESMAA